MANDDVRVAMPQSNAFAYGTYTSMPLVDSPTSMTASESPSCGQPSSSSSSYVSLGSLTNGTRPASPPPTPLLPNVGERTALVRKPAWGGFGGVNLAARRGQSAPELPRIYVTPPTPSSYALEAGEPWQQLSAQIYIGTSLGLGALAATGLALGGTPHPYFALGLTGLVAGGIGVAQTIGLQGPLRHASTLQWPLAAAQGAVLGAALAPALDAIARAAPPDMPNLVAGSVASAIALGAACGDWRRLAQTLRRDGSADALRGMPVEVWGFATLACGGLALIAGGTGIFVGDDALTGMGCTALLGVPASLAAYLATA